MGGLRSPDLTGHVFGRLTVVRRAARHWSGHAAWECICDCGNTSITLGTYLRTGATKSCGCHVRNISSERLKKHGLSKTPAYRVWSSMHARCRPNHAQAKDYAMRGITVCERWSTFENFLADMGQPPPGLTLERRNNDAGYSPENCEWATRVAQRANRRPQKGQSNG